MLKVKRSTYELSSSKNDEIAKLTSDIKKSNSKN